MMMKNFKGSGLADDGEISKGGTTAPDKAADKTGARVNIERYKDPEGLTVGKMRLGLWLVEHRHLLANIAKGAVLFVVIATWSYTLFGLGHYFFFGLKKDREMVAQMVQNDNRWHDLVISASPREVVVFTPRILPVGNGQYDFLVQINNPNARHWGEIEYHFAAGGEIFASDRNFILPGESKYIFSLAREIPGRSTNAQFVIDQVVWRRIDPRLIRDVNGYVADRLDFEISGINFTPARFSGLSDRVNLNSLEFTAQNRSAYGYWLVDFIILLYERGVIAGVNHYTAEQFRSGETRAINLSWPGTLGVINQVEIMPYVNIMDDGSYMPPAGF